jgi:hypothetical protein
MMPATLDAALQLDPSANLLAAPVISDEDLRVLTGELDPLDRLTCPLHLTWLYRCAHSPRHVDALIGYRWCQRCRHDVRFAFDELAGHATLRCLSCGRGAQTALDARIVLTCEQSFAAARAHRAAPSPRLDSNA